MKGFDNELANAGFEKIAGQTLGIWPISLSAIEVLLNEEVGWKLHLSLQKLADKGFPCCDQPDWSTWFSREKHALRSKTTGSPSRIQYPQRVELALDRAHHADATAERAPRDRCVI